MVPTYFKTTFKLLSTIIIKNIFKFNCVLKLFLRSFINETI